MNEPARLVRGAALWALLFSFAACRQVLDVDDYGTLPPDACDGVEYISASCRDCVYRGCCEEASACSVDPACRAMAECLARCERDDHACRGVCNLSIPRTKAMHELVGCEATHCQECGSSRLVWGGEACDECLSQTCGRAVDALSRDPSALRLELCERDCPDTAPECSCDPHRAGEATLRAVRACVTGSCSTVCQPEDNDWSCLGSVQWPEKASATDELVLHVRALEVDAQSFGTPLPSFEISACGFPAIDCDSPLDSATGNAAGWAMLDIPRSSRSEFDEFFRYLLVGHPSLEAEGLLYFFPPVRTSASWALRPVVSKAFADMTAGDIGVTLDWVNKGGIVFSSSSCGMDRRTPEMPFGATAAPAEGMQVTVDGPAGAKVYYYGASNSVDPDATQTSSVGIGFITGVEPGARTLEATVGTDLRVGTYPVVVRAGSITHVTIAPAPDSG